ALAVIVAVAEILQDIAAAILVSDLGDAAGAVEALHGLADQGAATDRVIPLLVGDLALGIVGQFDPQAHAGLAEAAARQAVVAIRLGGEQAGLIVRVRYPVFTDHLVVRVVGGVLDVAQGIDGFEHVAVGIVLELGGVADRIDQSGFEPGRVHRGLGDIAAHRR